MITRSLNKRAIALTTTKERMQQYIGYILINKEKIKVLVKEGKTYRSLKIREFGADGVFLANESDQLSSYPSVIRELKDGSQISV